MFKLVYIEYNILFSNSREYEFFYTNIHSIFEDIIILNKTVIDK